MTKFEYFRGAFPASPVVNIKARGETDCRRRENRREKAPGKAKRVAISSPLYHYPGP